MQLIQVDHFFTVFMKENPRYCGCEGLAKAFYFLRQSLFFMAGSYIQK